MSRGITALVSLALLLAAAHSLPRQLSSGDECDILRLKAQGSFDLDIRAPSGPFAPNLREAMTLSGSSQDRFQLLDQYLDCVSRSQKENIFEKFVDSLQRMTPLDPGLLSSGPLTDSEDHHQDQSKQTKDASVPSQLIDIFEGLKEVRYDEHISDKISVNFDRLLKDMSSLRNVESHRDEFFRYNKNTEVHEIFDQQNARQKLQNIGERNVDNDPSIQFDVGDLQRNDLQTFITDNFDRKDNDNKGYLNSKNKDFPKFVKRNFDRKEINTFDQQNFDREEINKFGPKNSDREEINKFGPKTFIRGELNKFGPKNFDREEINKFGPTNVDDDEINKSAPRIFFREEINLLGPSHFDSGILSKFGPKTAVERFNPTFSSSNIISKLVPASFEGSHFPKFDVDDFQTQLINDGHPNHLEEEES